MKDRDKNQTGIRLVDVQLKELEFSAANKEPEFPVKWNSNFNIERQFSENKKKLKIGLSVMINEDAEESLFDLSILIVGLFEQVSEGDISLEDFAETNAPAHLFPYLREIISNVTGRSGLPPLYLPAINVTALVNEENQD